MSVKNPMVFHFLKPLFSSICNCSKFINLEIDFGIEIIFEFFSKIFSKVCGNFFVILSGYIWDLQDCKSISFNFGKFIFFVYEIIISSVRSISVNHSLSRLSNSNVLRSRSANYAEVKSIFLQSRNFIASFLMVSFLGFSWLLWIPKI